MNWERVNQYYWQSDAGYRISKNKDGGLVKYTPWYRDLGSDGRNSWTAGKTSDVLDDAAAWCDEHSGVNGAG